MLAGFKFAGVCLLILGPWNYELSAADGQKEPMRGVASWYGEAHRGKSMANGKRFEPEKPTAASWFFPLGTRVRVTTLEGDQPKRSLIVTVTDRGPAQRFVAQGRIIDLAEGAFKQLGATDRGLLLVEVEPIVAEEPFSGR